MIVTTTGEHFADDLQRPRYHFVAEQNWMGDPCAPAFFNGFYHLFYQVCSFVYTLHVGCVVWEEDVKKE